MTTTRCFAVIPAAGRSVRMGEAKLCLRWGRSTVIDEVLRRWQQSGVDQVVVVVHPEDLRLAAMCREAQATVVLPPIAPSDMKASVRAGLEHIRDYFSPTPDDAWLLAPADMPWLEPDVIHALVTRYQQSSSDIVVPTYQQRRGHPVLFSWKLAAQVDLLPRDEGVRSLTRFHRVDEIAWPRETIHGDLNSPEEYRQQYDRYNPAS